MTKITLVFEWLVESNINLCVVCAYTVTQLLVQNCLTHSASNTHCTILLDLDLHLGIPKLNSFCSIATQFWQNAIRIW